MAATNRMVRGAQRVSEARPERSKWASCAKACFFFTSSLFLLCAIRAPSLQTVRLRSPCTRVPLTLTCECSVKPTSVVELACTRTGRSIRQTLASGDNEITACERVLGHDDNSVYISCCVASVQSTTSLMWLFSTLNMMRTSESHKEVSYAIGEN